MPADPDRVRSLFLAAVELPAADRPGFVAAVPDPGERAELARLLAAHDAPDARLDATAPHAPGEPTAAHATGDVGQEVAGRYKLLERIGEGGMGSVWMAEQRQPVRRLVAVKLIKPGLDTKAVLARFEAERQALAIMDHPNIARVLDAGETADSRPFFVMELVKGVPITRYCDAARLTPRQRLELFVPVCQAIQHAHTKGVIHRDVKPGNVLVAQYDGRPVPKVIDFGIAKAAGQALTEKTLHTGFGAVVGTPEYMSPEQASFNQLDIDTRSDVYSLGVLLYELLTGGPPFSGKELATAGLLEMLRVVREQEPPRPSARLSTSTKLASLAAVRGTEPARLAGLVRGEVDWIVMKALEKDRGRRYETATDLAADVMRHLAGEPVQAVPPSTAYRVRKFVRRNRVAAAVAAGFLLLTWAGASGVYFAYRRAVAAEAVARSEQQQAEDARQGEAAQRRAAELTAAGLRVDLDLAEFQTDPKVGLLRLARTLRGLPADAHDLRKFLVVCVLTCGQRFAPLLPPLTHDGRPIQNGTLSPDARTVLTYGGDKTARLWDTATARLIAVLRQGDERVLGCGYSPDGKTVYTDDEDGVLRFWDAPAGTFRARTAARPDRATYPGSRFDYISYSGRGSGELVALTNNRALTRHGPVVMVDWSEDKVPLLAVDEFDLLDTSNGLLIARRDHPRAPDQQLYFTDRPNQRIQLDGSGRWIFAIRRSEVTVFSTADGCQAARISLPPTEEVQRVFSSPSGQHVVLLTFTETDKPDVFRWWNTDGWAVSGPPIAISTGRVGGAHPGFCGEDRFLINNHDVLNVIRLTSRPEPPEFFCSTHLLDVQSRKGFLLAESGILVDQRTGRRAFPLSGKRYHPALTQFAPDGRFVPLGSNPIVDTLTERTIPFDQVGDGSDSPAELTQVIHLPRLGLVESSAYHGIGRIVPTAASVDLDPHRLELWAQVAARGDLGPDGEFAKWDEPTWERKRQELAAEPPPQPGLPFPGHVAADRLHWLRAEYEAAEGDDKPRLARELFRRAEAAGDRNEARRWRAEGADPEVAPPPRPVP